MSRKPIELPPDVARDFVRRMHAFFAEKNPINADAIAAEQLSILREYQTERMRLTDVKSMFVEMRAHLQGDQS